MTKEKREKSRDGGKCSFTMIIGHKTLYFYKRSKFKRKYFFTTTLPAGNEGPLYKPLDFVEKHVHVLNEILLDFHRVQN